jgi:DNA-binding Xre family transcriptional regulator
MPDDPRGAGVLPAFDDIPQRRWWLLCKALDCSPLTGALELARAADEFLTVAPSGIPFNPPDMARTPARSDQPECREEASQTGHTGLSLSATDREELLDLLARGAKNAELAHRFGLTSRQVQGIRMGSARRIAKRRQENGTQQETTIAETLPASVNDIVRFVRQQDDVVVPRGKGEFLVNGRFSLNLAELVDRANRTRLRQGKPTFSLGGVEPIGSKDMPVANGHSFEGA